MQSKMKVFRANGTSFSYYWGKLHDFQNGWSGKYGWIAWDKAVLVPQQDPIIALAA